MSFKGKQLTIHPLVEFNRKLASQLKEHGYKNMKVDFQSPPPMGDFHEDPSTPLMVFVSAERKKDNRWIKVRAIDVIARSSSPKDHFKQEGKFEELLDAFNHCYAETSVEDHIEMTNAMKGLREEAGLEARDDT